METLWVTAWSLIDRWRVSGMSRVRRFILTVSIGVWGVGGASDDSGGAAIGAASGGSDAGSDALTHSSSWACWGLEVKATFLPEVLVGVLLEVLAGVLARVLRRGMGSGGMGELVGEDFLGDRFDFFSSGAIRCSF